ncbi:hypothetical protein [Micromonospora sp. RV43]|uniref:hypothetical protein n=1 Tax=Micromonospora sp. RV43 TaxID=1661387 RepID=UPI00064C46BD|nr:hypothetical protein [Micromonospora sp. RV43]
MGQIIALRRKLRALASRLGGKGRTTYRYGFVEFSSLDAYNEPTFDRWTFLLDESVTDFAAAWQAAVATFCNDRRVFTDVVQNRMALAPNQLVAEYPDILAAHGLTLASLPDGPSVVIADDLLVTSGDRRCVHECADGLLCGRPLDHDRRDRTCGRHPQELTT